MIDPQDVKPEPPEHLCEAAKSWWRRVNEKYDFEPHQLHQVEEAANALHRCHLARAVLDKEGLTFKDRFKQPKARPEAAIARDNAVLFSRICRELRLDIEGGDVDTRLPRDNGRYR